MLAALSLLMLGFTGVYRGESRDDEPRMQPRNQIVRIERENPEERQPARRIVPLHSLDQRSAPLNQETPYIATKENPWSGQTAEQTREWSPAKPDAGLQDDRPRAEKQSEERDGIETRPEESPLFPFEAGMFTRATVQQMMQTEKILSPFQELPQALRPDARLLVHFQSRGQVSLGTMAEKNAEYFHAMVRKISGQWGIHFPRFQHFYGLLKEGEVYLVFELDLDGNVTSARIVQSYGQPSIDDSCLRAIQGAANFGPIPVEYRDKGKMIIPFVFVYHRPDQPMKMFH